MDRVLCGHSRSRIRPLTLTHNNTREVHLHHCHLPSCPSSSCLQADNHAAPAAQQQTKSPPPARHQPHSMILFPHTHTKHRRTKKLLPLMTASSSPNTLPMWIKTSPSDLSPSAFFALILRRKAWMSAHCGCGRAHKPPIPKASQEKMMIVSNPTCHYTLKALFAGCTTHTYAFERKLGVPGRLCGARLYRSVSLQGLDLASVTPQWSLLCAQRVPSRSGRIR